MNFVITGLITAGGLGFFVIVELLSWLAARRRAFAHSGIVLTASAILSIGGSAFLILGRNLAPSALPTVERVLAAWFQSVTSRTAGHLPSISAR